MFSKRLDRITPSATLEMTAKAAELRQQGIDVLNFSVGEPDFNTPEHIVEAAVSAMNNGFTKYTPGSGTYELKKAVCNKLLRDNNLKYQPENIIVSCGGKHALYNACQVLFEHGDEVIIFSPYWVSFPDFVSVTGATPIYVNTVSNKQYEPDFDDLQSKISDKTKGIIINSPSNPTGSGYTKDEIIALSKILIKYKNLYILSDDIYEHITYDNFNFFTTAQVSKLKNRTLTMNGVSKSYAMTGWRIGYAAGPKEIIKAISKIQSQSTSNPSSVSQAAAVEALNGNQDFIQKRSDAFKERRDFVVNSLNNIKGLSCLKPNGAFYVFPSCKKLLNKKTKLKTDSDFVEKLLEKANVAVVQGSAFGLDGHFRISYATSMDNLKKAIDRIKSFCENLT